MCVASRGLLLAGALDFDAPPSPVAESGCGIAAKPEAPDEIVMAVRKLVTMPPEERDAMGQRGRKEVLEKYNYSALARKFVDVME